MEENLIAHFLQIGVAHPGHQMNMTSNTVEHIAIFFLSNEFLISAITKIQLLTDMIFCFVLSLKNLACNLRNKNSKTWIILQEDYRAKEKVMSFNKSTNFDFFSVNAT